MCISNSDWHRNMLSQGKALALIIGGASWIIHFSRRIPFLVERIIDRLCLFRYFAKLFLSAWSKIYLEIFIKYLYFLSIHNNNYIEWNCHFPMFYMLWSSEFYNFTYIFIYLHLIYKFQMLLNQITMCFLANTYTSDF